LAIDKAMNDKLQALPPKELRKGVGTIQMRVISGKRTLLQRKMSNAFFKHAVDQGFDKETYSISKSLFQEYSGFNSNDKASLRQAAEQLTSTRIVFDILNESTAIDNIGAVVLLSAVNFRSDGHIYYEIPKLTKQMISNPQEFGLINMQVQSQFDSNPGLILYEHCMVYVDQGETPIWSVEVWKTFLEVDENQTTYSEFKHFNSKIIKFGVNEVNRISDIEIEPIYYKRGRVVESLQFKVRRKPQQLLDFGAAAASLNLQERITEFGVSEKMAERLVQEFDEERISGNIDYVRRQMDAGKVKDASAFLVKAIKEDYRPSTNVVSSKKQEEDAEKKARAEARAAADLVEKEKRDQHTKVELDRASVYLEGLDDVAKLALLDSYETHLKLHNKTVLKAYKKSGIDSKIVMTALLRYICEHVINESSV
jgi:hypothetical protein